MASVAIHPLLGPEVLAGSTRLAAASACKLVLDTLTTGAMVRLGHVYRDRMVDVEVSNQKLRDRAIRMVADLTHRPDEQARAALESVGWWARAAIVRLELDLDADEARTWAAAHPRLRDALGDRRGGGEGKRQPQPNRGRKGGHLDPRNLEDDGTKKPHSLGWALLLLGGGGWGGSATKGPPPATQPAATVNPPTAPRRPAGAGGKVELTIESWRNDDLTIWQDKIIPAFEAKNPNIKVTFTPTAPTDYNGVLDSKLEGGTAGDLITCRPFDLSLGLFNRGYLASINDLPGMKNFGDVAKSAWITDDGKTVFCVPMASVIHGFIYNKDVFTKLGITTLPTTVAEFHALLDKIKKDGKYTPLAMGTKDMWESATMGFQNIGPNYWKGEDGRKALIAGTAKFTDQPYVDTFAELATWKPYLPKGFEAIAYADAQQYFATGKAAIYPAGSWDIAYFEGTGSRTSASSDRLSRTPATSATSATTPTSPWASTPRARTRPKRRPSCHGWQAPTSRRSTPTRCRASTPSTPAR